MGLMVYYSELLMQLLHLEYKDNTLGDWDYTRESREVSSSYNSQLYYFPDYNNITWNGKGGKGKRSGFWLSNLISWKMFAILYKKKSFWK